MEESKIRDGIEAILFASGRVITTIELAEVLNIQIELIEEAIRSLEEKYSSGGGISLVNINGGYEIVSNKECFDFVNKFVANSKKETLSNTCMEVLSIVAYNPKITKSEIEKIRGVNSDSQVSRLLEYGLIEEVGRLKLPGRPAAFSITNEFLKCMGISKVSELPSFDEIKTKDEQIDEKREIIEE